MNELPRNKIKLDQCTTIIDGRKFVDSHIATLLANPKKKVFMPYYTRLMAYAEIVNEYNEQKERMINQLNSL